MSDLVTITTSDICNSEGVNKRTVHRWVSDGGLPVFKRGSGTQESEFLLKDYVRWYHEREKRQLVTNASGEVYDRSDEEARLKHHQANIEELKESERRGELVPVALVVDEYTAFVSNAKAKLLEACDLVPKDSTEKVRAAVHRALDELSRPIIEV